MDVASVRPETPATTRRETADNGDQELALTVE
jgi:hypothetical protein